MFRYFFEALISNMRCLLGQRDMGQRDRFR